MAKKDPTIESLLKMGLVMKGNDPRLEIRRLATGIPGFDGLLGGGYPGGRITQIVGPESTAKTVLAQYAVAAQQQDQELPDALLVDTERSYEQRWWAASGVNTDALMVSQPMYGEEAVDVMLATIKADPELGIIVLDSAAALYPKAMVEPPDGAEQHFMGAQAKLVARMLAMMMPQIDDIVFIIINQMRANIGGHEEIYPGGWAMRHQNHITLRTRRAGWIVESDKRVGFIMEVINKKNKVGGIQNADIQIPFRFRGQIDLIDSYIGEAIDRKVITQRTPYYHFGDKKWLGKAAMRQFFTEDTVAFEELKVRLA